MAVSLARTLATPPARLGPSTNATWRVDVDALERACARLQLRMPVVVCIVRGRGGRRWDGLHRRANGEHVLSVRAGLSAEAASRYIWHELEHAAQYEAEPLTFDADYRAESRARGYEANRFEVGARRAERRHEVWFALVVA